MYVLLVQERPVTKEVVTYVQERRPVAKQVRLLLAKPLCLLDRPHACD